jgi:hypothetical protein
MNDPQRQIDTRAIEIARDALSKIDSHEEICSVRQSQIMGKLDSLHNTMGWAVRGLILLLLSIIGYFLIHGGIPQAKAHIVGHPEFDEWLMSMKVPDGTGAICCDKSDAYLLDDSDVRVTDGQYQARVNGEWLTFPNTGQGNRGNTVFGAVNNPTGGAVAWVFHGLPRCFAEGAGT